MKPFENSKAKVDSFCCARTHDDIGNEKAVGRISEKASSSGRPATCCADQDGIHQVFRALSHPTRLTILEFLSDRPEASCGDIVSALPLAQSTVSQHLQVLKDTGILTCTVHGRSCYYTLDRAVVGEAKLQVDELWQRFKSE